MAEGDGLETDADLNNPGETPHGETENKANENGTSPGQKSPATTPKVEPEATNIIGQDCNEGAPDRQETPKESNKIDVALASQSAPAAEAVKTPDGAGNLEESILVALWSGKFSNLS